jgi:hypothetical protein
MRFILLGCRIIDKQYTRLERVARDKRSSLLRKFVIYDRKKIYNIGPWSGFEPSNRIELATFCRKGGFNFFFGFQDT